MPRVKSFSISIIKVSTAEGAKQRWSTKVSKGGEVVLEMEHEGGRSDAAAAVAGFSLPRECLAMLTSLFEVEGA